MGNRKTDKERLEAVQENIRKQQAIERALRARINEKERKARTKRLIELGALLESLTGISFDSPEKRERLKTYLTHEYKNGTVAQSIASYVQSSSEKSI